MKRHTLTAIVLAGALAVYAAGLEWSSAALFVWGVALEFWFWLRLESGDSQAPAQPPSDKQPL